MKSLITHYKNIITEADTRKRRPSMIIISQERFEVLRKEFDDVMNSNVLTPKGGWDEASVFQHSDRGFLFDGVFFTTNPRILTETYIEWRKIEQ